MKAVRKIDTSKLLGFDREGHAMWDVAVPDIEDIADGSQYLVKPVGDTKPEGITKPDGVTKPIGGIKFDAVL